MRYEGDVYRPPSEARSLIIQATVGCTHNRCTFCPMYKDKTFHVRPFEAVLEDLKEARGSCRQVGRVFLADGDALCMASGKLLRLLRAVRALFPECGRVSAYSRAEHILRKSEEELRALRGAGLGIVYLGAESGSDEVLRRVQKGETAQRIIEAVRKIEDAGISASVTFISGLGGRELMREHAERTGEMIAVLGASYVGLLTLVLTPQTPMYADERDGRFTRLTPRETLEELELILERADCGRDTVLRSNHASNWLALRGTLPRDKARLLGEVRAAMADAGALRPFGGSTL